MDNMDFWEIGKLVSEDRLSLEYLWKKRGNTSVLMVIHQSSITTNGENAR
jgi:hypothetical protein